MTTEVRESESTALTVRETDATGSISAFASSANYEAAKKMAVALSNSTIVPEAYRGERGVANCLIALELAGRTGASVMMVMQNLHVIDGKPSWSSAFLIASVNSCGRFSPIRYEVEGEFGKEGFRCRAYARELSTGDRLDGEWITWKMITSEGWMTRRHSKWPSMGGQMARYRAAAFWTRTYCPEISLGMHTADEVEDIGAPREPSAKTQDLNAALRAVEVEVVQDGTVPNPDWGVVAINSTDVPCPECDAKPYEPHKGECPYA